jgi:tetratricopeptide (TPR) repeat protein
MLANNGENRAASPPSANNGDNNSKDTLPAGAAVSAAGGIGIEIRSWDVASRKTWSFQPSGVVQVTQNAPAVYQVQETPTAFSDGMRSAANLAVEKFLLGPLAPYAQAASTLSAAPSVPASLPGNPVMAADGDEQPSPQQQRPRPAAVESEALRIRGVALLEAGETEAAIVALRRAVDLQPRASTPRVVLTQAYLKAGRGTDAVDEARRALTLMPAGDSAGELELTRLLARGLSVNGDTTAARAAYEQILLARPRATWARLALGDLLIEQNRPADAEAQWRQAQKMDPGSRDVAERLARHRADAGDFAGAIAELDALKAVGTPLDPPVRSAILQDLFARLAANIVGALTRERGAFAQGKTALPAFAQAVSREAERANALLPQIESIAPAADAAPALVRVHKQRVYAARLIAQATTSLLDYLRTGDASFGVKADLHLDDAKQALANTQSSNSSSSN